MNNRFAFLTGQLFILAAITPTAMGAGAPDPLAARLQEIVDINSGSANIAGVAAVQKKIQPWFEDLGFKTELRANPNGEKVSAPMLIATYPGKSPKTITFIAHADTVFEPTSPFQKFEARPDGTATGPGVIDDKGGIVVLAQALRDFLAAQPGKTPPYTLRVEVTPNEEVGATGFNETFHKMSEDSVLVLGLEPSYQEGIVEGRKGNVWYEISVTGKEAHAGVNHDQGINACDILASKINEIRKLTDYKKKVTVSIGHMEGGQDKYNIVCGWAKAKLDTRIPSPEARQALNARIEAILKDPRITYQIVDETAPMPLDPASKPYLERYLDGIAKVEGKRPKAVFTGGVGDANHFARKGLPIMDGLGPVGAEMHTAREYIVLGSLATRARVLTQFLLSLGNSL